MACRSNLPAVYFWGLSGSARSKSAVIAFFKAAGSCRHVWIQSAFNGNQSNLKADKNYFIIKSNHAFVKYKVEVNLPQRILTGF